MTAGPGARPARVAANAITVDVEDWFHVCGVGGALAPERWDRLVPRVVETTRRLLDEFDRASRRATFFVLGWVADRYPGLVAEIAAAGHEVGSHGYAHARVYEQTSQTFVADLRRSMEAIRAATGADVRLYRAPEWSINDRSLWALPLLVREGFHTDASMAPLRLVGSVAFPRRPHVRRTSAGEILEVPPLVADRFGQVVPMGWGWGLRMSSPGRVLRAIAAANAGGAPAVLTVHPWELDPDPPRVALPARLRFAHYFRLSGFQERLAAILRGADVGALGDLAAVREYA